MDEKLFEYQKYLMQHDAALEYDIKVQGGLLKITPKGYPGKLLLELEQETLKFEGMEIGYYGEVCLYRHRDPDLTTQYKGEHISKEWVLEFLTSNIQLTRELAEQHSNSPHEESHSESVPYFNDGSHCRSCGKLLEVCICK